ncbi:MAG: 1-deoxy-D-xylulose-5-phosphate reductoisomerase, partial [Synergistaceae bacterium]|nr:1-deoxy-D-xylulose-5-phosphate reductoisomerase [Synergistaceae bacterium]
MTKHNEMQNIAVIGATGSVGSSVLDVCSRFPECFRVVALAANSNEKKLKELGHAFSSKILCLSNPEIPFSDDDFTCLSGIERLSEIVCSPDVDQVVFASSGTAAIPALQCALKAGKKVSLANKESIVVAGPWVMPLVQYKNQLRPVDSEHSAVWQCMEGTPAEEVEKLWLTASGGPFRDFSAEQMEKVTPSDALKHPTWNMGAKITIDSATLMNKGIECIEAAQLFGMAQEKVGALVHSGSYVHGLVRFIDGTTKML